jgi:hypothetical protein
MKRIIKFGFLIISCFILVTSLSSMVEGDSQKPEWEVGNEWKYEMTVMDIKGTVAHKVSEIKNINVNGTNYDVYHVKVIGSGGTEDLYYTISDLALVKMEVPSTAVSSSLTFTYYPPKKEFDFPLAIEKTWNSTYNMTIYSGESDPTDVTMKEDYFITKIENLTIKAGTFECYKIESVDRYESVHTTRWYSKEVKNIVKSSVNMSGMITEMELVSFSHGDKEDGSDSQDLPQLILFIIIPIIIMILIAILVLTIKKRKAKEQQHIQSTTEPKSTHNGPPPPPSNKPLQPP